MDLYGTEVEMAEPDETHERIRYSRKMRMQFDVPHQAEGSKHTHDGEFFQSICKLRLMLFMLPEHEGKLEPGNLTTRQ